MVSKSDGEESADYNLEIPASEQVENPVEGCETATILHAQLQGKLF